MTLSSDEIKTKSKTRTIPHVVLYTLAVSFVLGLRYASIFAGNAVFSSETQLRYLRPTIEFFREQVQSHGTVPGWNPFCYFGMPLLPGCFPGSYYPLNAILMIQNSDIACAMFLLMHQVVGFIGIYLLLSSQAKMKLVALLVLSILYCVASLVMVSDSNLALAATLAWLPFCIYAALRCTVREESKPHRLGLVITNSIFIALMFLSGSLLVGFGAVSVLLLALLVCWMRGVETRFGMYVVAIVVSLCLAAPVLLPVLDWIKDDTVYGAVRNLMRAAPRIVFGSNLLMPETMTQEQFSALSVKRDEMLKAVQGNIGHQGRYLVASSERRIDSEVVRSVLPNANAKMQLVSPFGYLGHPVGSYRKFVKDAIGLEPDNAISLSAKDRKTADRILKFSQFTSVGMIVTSCGDAFDADQGVLTNWRSFMAPMKNEPKPWVCLLQDVVAPVAYTMDAWHWVKGRDELIQQYFDGERSFDSRFQLIVEKPDSVDVDEERLDALPLSQVSPPSGPPLADSKGGPLFENEARCKPVEVMVYEPEHVSLSVNARAPSFVVLRDAFYPGWKAYVDSTPAPMFRANGFARAVFVAAGSHLVTFDYRPSSARLGFNLAISALIINAFLSFFWLSKLLGKTIRFLSVGKFE